MNEVWTKEQILEHIQQGSRATFQEIMAEYLRQLMKGLQDEPVVEFTKRAPDRAAQGAVMYARLSGYHDKLELGGAMGLLDLTRLSDAELQKRLLELQREMAALPSAPPKAEGAGDS